MEKGAEAEAPERFLDDRGVVGLLVAAGLAPTAWRRFASSGADAPVAAWPTAAGEGEAAPHPPAGPPFEEEGPAA